MQLGMPLAEYEHSVGPRNKFYHELAEAHYLAREGVIRPDEDEEDADALDSAGSRHQDPDSERRTARRKSTDY